jgi:hypothetical protein
VDEKQRGFGVEGQFSATTSVNKEELLNKYKRAEQLLKKYREIQTELGNVVGAANNVNNSVNNSVNNKLLDMADETNEKDDSFLSIEPCDDQETVDCSDTVSDSKDQPEELFDAIIADIEGQVLEATSKVDYYNRWGATYLRSLLGAHRFQRRNNFKDPGVQLYNNFENNAAPCFFERIVTSINDIFDNLTPPKPSARTNSYGGGNYTAVVSMSSYNNRYGPCFSGDTLLKMADGSAQRADTIHKGSVVLTGQNHTPARVKCVLETRGDNMGLIRMQGTGVVVPAGGAAVGMSHLRTPVPVEQSPRASSLFVDGPYGLALGAEYDLHQDMARSFATTAYPSSPMASDSDMEGSPQEIYDNIENNFENAIDTEQLRKDEDDDVSPCISPAVSLNDEETLTGSFAITPWHPVYDPISNHWVFPRDIAVAVKGATNGGAEDPSLLYGLPPSQSSFKVVTAVESTNTVYNFLLDEDVADKTILVGGLAPGGSKQAWVTSCTLGHSLASDEVIAHSSVGNYQKIVKDLESMIGWDPG